MTMTLPLIIISGCGGVSHFSFRNISLCHASILDIYSVIQNNEELNVLANEKGKRKSNRKRKLLARCIVQKSPFDHNYKYALLT